MKNPAKFAAGLAMTISATILLNHDINTNVGLNTWLSLGTLVCGAIVLALGVGERR